MSKNEDFEFDFSALQLNDNAACHIKYPDGRPCYLPKKDENGNKVDDESKPLMIHLFGADSTQARRALLVKIRKQDAINRKRHKDALPSDSEIESLRKVNVEFVADLTSGWDNFKEQFSREQAVEFYTKYPVIYEQVDKFIGDRANYVKS